MTKLRVLDLFSGIGGFSLGLERTGGFKTVAFCEIEEFPRKVLRKHWPDVPQFEDVRKLRGEDVGAADVICGGYPCQPFSAAGQRRGAEDDRHLWPEFSRLVAELRPAWVIGENVAGHISMGLDGVLSDLEGQGYACRTFVIPACAVGAPHRRDRCWTVAHRGRQRAGQDSGDVAHATGSGSQGSDKSRGGWEIRGARIRPKSSRNGGCGTRQDVADAGGWGQQGQGQPIHASDQTTRREGKATELVNGGERPERIVKPGMGGMADGFSRRLDEPRERVKVGVPNKSARLKALGNAVVPQIPEMIGCAILAAEQSK